MDILDEIKELVLAESTNPNLLAQGINKDDPLLELGVIDSFGLISLVTGLETKFNIQLDPDDLNKENFTSIQSMAQLIQSKQ